MEGFGWGVSFPGIGRALSRHEPDLEGVSAVDAHYGAHATHQQPELGEGPTQYHGVQYSRP